MMTKLNKCLFLIFVLAIACIASGGSIQAQLIPGTAEEFSNGSPSQDGIEDFGAALSQDSESEKDLPDHNKDPDPPVTDPPSRPPSDDSFLGHFLAIILSVF